MRKITAIAGLFTIMIAPACNSIPEKDSSSYYSDNNEHYSDNNEQPAEARPKRAESTTQAAPAKWAHVADMTENSFSIDMPAGWTNAALLHRVNGSPRSLVTTVSPDKNTVIYLGDPRLPVYTVPGSGLEAPYRQFNMKYPYEVGQLVSADAYFRDYLRKYFSEIEGFRIIEKFDNHPLLELQKKEMDKLKLNMEVSNASFRFEYTSKDRVIRGEINGTVVSLGKMWLPEVSGFCTTDDPGQAAVTMIRMMKSKVNNPAWQEAQNAKHQQTMASIEQNTQRMTQQHQQNMANIQRSAAAHQQRMADLHQSADARNEQWRRNQQAQDVQHEKFLNSIKGEHTVMDEEGNTYQVDNSQDKYFIDKTNNTYIGTDATKTLDDLRKIQHINIDNFQNVQIIR